MPSDEALEHVMLENGVNIMSGMNVWGDHAIDDGTNILQKVDGTICGTVCVQ